MSARAIRHLLDLLGRLRAILGAPGLMIGLFSLLSFGFGLFVLAREYDRPRQTGRVALHQVLNGWVRAPDYLGLILIDHVDRWREAAPEARADRQALVRDALNDLGAELARQGNRFPLVRIVGIEVAPRRGQPLARWGAVPTSGPPGARGEIVDRIPLIASGDESAIDLLVRYRVAPSVEDVTRDLETSYHRLLLALLGLSGYSLLCLGYMILHAQALSDRVAREAAQEAALDLADRACHELGNGVFVLANERRNLANHLDLIDRFVAEESEARAAAARRLEIDPMLAARWNHALNKWTLPSIIGSMDTDQELNRKFASLLPCLDKRQRRLFAAAEARSLGYGGISRVSRASGLSRVTIQGALKELDSPQPHPGRIRRPGGGRKKLPDSSPQLLEALEELIAPETRGDPRSPLRWTCKSTRQLSG